MCTTTLLYPEHSTYEALDLVYRAATLGCLVTLAVVACTAYVYYAAHALMSDAHRERLDRNTPLLLVPATVVYYLCIVVIMVNLASQLDQQVLDYTRASCTINGTTAVLIEHNQATYCVPCWHHIADRGDLLFQDPADRWAFGVTLSTLLVTPLIWAMVWVFGQAVRLLCTCKESI